MKYFITAGEDCQYACFCKIPPKSGVSFPLCGHWNTRKGGGKNRKKKKKSRQPLKGIPSGDGMPQLMYGTKLHAATCYLPQGRYLAKIDLDFGKVQKHACWTGQNWVEGKVLEDLDTPKTTFLQYFLGLHSREASAWHSWSICLLPGQSMDQDASTIRSAAEKLSYNDDLVRDQFLQGLPKHLQLQLGMAAQQNLHHLIGLAQIYVDLMTNTGWLIISKFYGTSTPKGHTVPKQVSQLDDDDITETTRKKMSWFYSLRTALSKNCTVWEHSLSGQVWTKCLTRPDTQGAPRGGCSLHQTPDPYLLMICRFSVHLAMIRLKICQTQSQN